MIDPQEEARGGPSTWLPVLATVVVVALTFGWWWSGRESRAGQNAEASTPTLDRAIYRFDPIVRDDAGQPTGERRELPDGWWYCDGQHGTVDLDVHEASSVIYVQATRAGVPVPAGVTLADDGDSK